MKHKGHIPDSFDNFFKDSLKDYEAPYDEGVWNKVEQSLNKGIQSNRKMNYSNYAQQLLSFLENIDVHTKNINLMPIN